MLGDDDVGKSTTIKWLNEEGVSGFKENEITGYFIKSP